MTHVIVLLGHKHTNLFVVSCMTRHEEDGDPPGLERFVLVTRRQLPVYVPHQTVTVSGASVRGFLLLPSPSPTGIARNTEGHELGCRVGHVARVRRPVHCFRQRPAAQTHDDRGYEEDLEHGQARNRGSLSPPSGQELRNLRAGMGELASKFIRGQWRVSRPECIRRSPPFP